MTRRESHESLPEQIMEHAEAMPEATPICPAALLHLAKGPQWVRRSLAWPVQAGSCGSAKAAKGSTCGPIESRVGRCAPSIEKSPQVASELWGEDDRSRT